MAEPTVVESQDHGKRIVTDVPLSLRYQQKVSVEIARILHAMLNPETPSVELRVNALGQVIRSRTFASTAEGIHPVDAPDGLGPHLSRLRMAMYQPGNGTWFSMRMTVELPARVTADFEYEDEPDFGDAPLPESSLTDELARYPRDPEHVPDWLRGRITTDPVSDSDLTLHEQHPLIDEIGQILLGVLDPRHSVLELRVSGVGRLIEYQTYGGEPGDLQQVEVPDGTGYLVSKLRREMYVPGVGTWTVMTETVSASGQVSATFSSDEPMWLAFDPVPATFVEELELYPRDPKYLPDWLRVRITPNH